jgi:integrase
VTGRGQRGDVEDRWVDRAGRPTKAHGKGSQWRARFVTATGVEQEKLFRRKADARAWLATQTAAVTVGTYVAPAAGRIRCGVLFDGHLAAKSHLTPKSFDSLRSIVEHRLRPAWGHLEVAAVLPSDVQAWVSRMVAEGLSSSRARQCFHTLQAVFDVAVRDRRIAANPCTGIDVPKLVTTAEHRYLTMAELLTLARAAGDDGDVVLVLGLCGLRWGELVALRVGDVDLTRRRLRVLRSTSEVGGKLIDNPTPKGKQRREVGVPDVLLAALAARCAGKLPAARLFTTERGATLRSRNFRRDSFDPAVEAVGLKGLTIHQLRHTAASLAIGNGASVLAVSRMLGHADPSVTLRIYAGLFDAELDTVADRLAGAFKIAAGDLRAIGPA